MTFRDHATVPVNDDMSMQGILLDSTLALRIERWQDRGEPDVTVGGRSAGAEAPCSGVSEEYCA